MVIPGTGANIVVQGTTGDPVSYIPGQIIENPSSGEAIGAYNQYFFLITVLFVLLWDDSLNLIWGISPLLYFDAYPE